jgi:hypothetical protein
MLFYLEQGIGVREIYGSITVNNKPVGLFFVRTTMPYYGTGRGNDRSIYIEHGFASGVVSPVISE